MEIAWKRMYLGSYHGFVGDQLVAQVGYVVGPDGEPAGWSLHLVRPEAEPFDYFPSQEAAQAAAEATLDGT